MGAASIYENSKPNQYYISGRILEINATDKNLKDGGLLILTISPGQLIYLDYIGSTWILENNSGLLQTSRL